LIAQSVKEQLVQDHRIHRDQLFALEPVDQETGRLVEFKLCKLIIDQIGALNRAAVIVLVMADNEPLRHILHSSGIAGQRLHVVRHGELLNSSDRRKAREQRTSSRCNACTPAHASRSPDMSGSFGPSKRNLLDKASAAQSLDGTRLTGSLLIPNPRI
jgi:hypothetical protein